MGWRRSHLEHNHYKGWRAPEDVIEKLVWNQSMYEAVTVSLEGRGWGRRQTVRKTVAQSGSGSYEMRGPSLYGGKRIRCSGRWGRSTEVRKDRRYRSWAGATGVETGFVTALDRLHCLYLNFRRHSRRASADRCGRRSSQEFLPYSSWSSSPGRMQIPGRARTVFEVPHSWGW